MKIGDGTEARRHAGPADQFEKAVDKVERHIADAVKRGAKDRHRRQAPCGLGGTFFEPTVLSDVKPDCAGLAGGNRLARWRR
jgi:succinate-semialdehyde dehydrogenase/glutarate-semialdehyde dehydrogenase